MSPIRLPADFIPRAWQEHALKAWSRSYRGIVKVTTGAGKTTFGALAIARFLADRPNGRVTISVPTIALQDQWYVELTETFGVAPASITLVGGGHHGASSETPFCIATINSLRARATDAATSLLIADECHRLGSRENSRVLQRNYAATLGLTATPEREHDEGFETLLEPLLGQIIFTYGYAEARRDGIISPFRLTNVRIKLLPAEKGEYERLSQAIVIAKRQTSEGTRQENGLKLLVLRRSRIVANAAQRVPVAVRLAIDAAGQCVVFHESTHAADTITNNLRSFGVLAVAYHSKLSAPLRLDNLRLFRRGDARVLVCCRALDEGLNVPNASVGIIASSSASARQRIQRLGRILRASPSKALAQVITVFATDGEERRLRREERLLSGVAEIAWQNARVGGSDG